MGIGAFAGPIRWMLGHDLTHDDAEYMAGKGQGRMKYWKYTTDHKVVGIQYLIMALVLFAGIRERLDGADVPTPFKGTAIALITAGLMSLAFMGFAGLDKYR